MRTRSDQLVAVATLGALVVVAGVLGLVSLYLGAVTQAMSGVQRGAALPDYPGRPEASAADGVAQPVRYLVLVTDDSGTLASAYLTQLSGARDGLHLIGLPADLLVDDANGHETSLAHVVGSDGAGAVRAIETLLQLRIDHLVVIDLDGFTRIVDVIGGVTVRNDAEMSADGWHFAAGEVRLTGPQALVYLSANKHPMVRLERSEAVFVEVLRGIVSGDALTNPAKVETIGDVLHHCVTVDADLTPSEIRRMALDVHVVSESIGAAPLPLAGASELDGTAVTVPDADRLAELARALAADRASAWTARQSDPWAPLAQLPPR
ncbi:LCP family protein [Micropruina sonneratiae]|uniref:LCP family protein n=1 Tax=Micropruina sonneratiae TaxID=2986940 RepID=UPI002226E059|nr:LCP family protein [Micropruina sp. KQZ13P-5]MCW3159229.1 LCP family protein [Micropruina sp. KQZ13P-5]